MNFIKNVDTICILIYIEDYENNSMVKEILELLQEEKENALINSVNSPTYKHSITINDMSFELLTNGTRGYAYIIHNNGYYIKIAKSNSTIKNFAPLQVKISSEYLWAYGLQKSWSLIYNWIVQTFGNISENKVSRVDICSHISNMDFITNYDKCYKGCYKKYNIYYTGNEINSICFGSRKSGIYCRIYNKVLELQETNKKKWFINIWHDNNMNIDNVWNVEFEIKSGFLRDYDIISVEDVSKNLRNIWEYCTKNWLQKIDVVNSRKERCNINKNWLELQKCYNNFPLTSFTKRENQIASDADSLIPALIGYSTSYAAKIGELDIKKAMFHMLDKGTLYLARKDITFEDKIKSKIPFTYDCEVQEYDD